MTTRPPTGDGGDAAAGWFPDEATLGRLANEFFKSPPGEQQVPHEGGGDASSETAFERYAGIAERLADEAVGYLAPDRLSGFRRSSLDGTAGSASPVAGPPATPGVLGAATAAALAEPARWCRQERFEEPYGRYATVPSYYFLEEDGRDLKDRSEDLAAPPFSVEAVRRDFPILSERIHGRQLVWLDNGATTQKPQVVIDRLAQFYRHENSNIHRSAHTLAARSSDGYEAARATVARFLGAGSASEIVFVRGTTEAINLVAKSWGRQNIKAGDDIVLSHLEHHANIVPWQLLAAETGARIRVIPVTDEGELRLDEYERLLSERTKIVAVAHVSNVLGTVVPVKALAESAHRHGAKVLVDGAQAVAHMPVDVQAIDADFYVFSGHKIFGPTGIGALYGKTELLEQMPPWQGGGNMIADVTFERTLYQPPPAKFEAGTGNMAAAIALATALDYVSRLGRSSLERYERELLEYATAGMVTVPGLRLIGTPREKASVLTFTLEGHRPEEIGAALDAEAIAVRAGHHCAQPILRRYGLEAAVRPSLAMYNTHDEVDQLVEALLRLSGNRGRRP